MINSEEATQDLKANDEDINLENESFLSLITLFGLLSHKIGNNVRQLYADIDASKIDSNDAFAFHSKMSDILFAELIDVEKNMEYLFSQAKTFNSYQDKLQLVFDCFESLRELVSLSGSYMQAFWRLSHSLNRGNLNAQRNINQSDKHGLNYRQRLSAQRRFKTVIINQEVVEHQEYPPPYGRYSTRSQNPDLYEEIGRLFGINKSHGFDYALVNSGMTAFVLADAIIGRWALNDELLIFDSGRYYELDWDIEHGGHSIFGLNLRHNTKRIKGNSFETWAAAERVLTEDSGGRVLLRFDVVSNDQQLTLSDFLRPEMLEKYNRLTLKQQKRLAFIIDTTLYPCISIENLQSLLPSECSVVTCASLSKYHQAGFDLDKLGFISSRISDPFRTPNLNSMISLSGLAPSQHLLLEMGIVCTQQIVELRMAIIARNTITMCDEFKSHGISANMIEIDDRFCKPELIGGLITIPKLGKERTKLLLNNLNERGIQVDIRTSFGHNITSLEDIPNDNAEVGWTRISVGIEDRDTIRLIAQVISTLLSQGEVV